MKLTNDQIERYRGQINLKKINIQGQIKLKKQKVLIIGVGGIGSPVALYLARAGICEFGFIDYDKVNKSNLHRQVLFNQIDIGKKKVIVTKKRKPYHREKDFTQLNLNPRKADILVVKIGYLVPELYNIRGGWNIALTPGGVDQDLERLGYKRIKRPMFPLDKQMDNVDLKTRFIKASDAL